MNEHWTIKLLQALEQAIDVLKRLQAGQESLHRIAAFHHEVLKGLCGVETPAQPDADALRRAAVEIGELEKMFSQNGGDAQ